MHKKCAIAIAIADADAMGKVCLIARSQHISMLWPRFLGAVRNCFPRPGLIRPDLAKSTRYTKLKNILIN